MKIIFSNNVFCRLAVVYLGHCPTIKMEYIWWKWLITKSRWLFSRKTSVIDVWQGFAYVSDGWKLILINFDEQTKLMLKQLLKRLGQLFSKLQYSKMVLIRKCKSSICIEYWLHQHLIQISEITRYCYHAFKIEKHSLKVENIWKCREENSWKPLEHEMYIFWHYT